MAAPKKSVALSGVASLVLGWPPVLMAPSVAIAFIALACALRLARFNSQIDADEQPIMWLSLSGEGWNTLQLSDYADRFLVDRFSSIDGVARVHDVGGDDARGTATQPAAHVQARLAHQPENRARFLLEAEVTGRLEHPGVVPLYGVGETSGSRLFYAMRFIDGSTLDEAIRR